MHKSLLRQNLALSAVLASMLMLVVTSCGGGGGGSASSGTTATTSPVLAGFCASVTYSAPSGAANNIVFTFEKQYRCGQFANGDWWVSPDSPGGTVRLTAISPSGVAGKHGFEINPASVSEQAFDTEAEVPFNSDLFPPLPVSVSGGASVVKAVSIVPNPLSRPALQFAAVLTVLDVPLANSSEYFRPAYFGATKTMFRVADVNLSLLPRLPTSAAVTSGGTIASVKQSYQGVRLDHVGNFTARDIHPKDSMPDYGAQIATNNAVALLRMSSDDFNPASNSEHLSALVNYLQMAIDLHAMSLGGTTWTPNGGHSLGRKLPLAFAAHVFTSAEAKAAFTSAIAASSFDEDLHVYRSPVNNKVLFGLARSELNYWQSVWSGGGRGARDVRDPYGLIDGGGAEVGAAYQVCCTAMPWKYTVLAAYIFNLETEFGSSNLFEYVERWVGHGVITNSDHCAPYIGPVDTTAGFVPADYGVTFGPNSATPGQCIVDGDGSDGMGRWPARDGTQRDSGTYSNTYGNQLWTWYKAQPGAKTTPYVP